MAAIITFLLSTNGTPGGRALMVVSKVSTLRVSAARSNRNDDPDPASWVTYQVDHFSTAGANAIIQVQNQFFRPALEKAWQQSGQYLWEDSLEIDTLEIYWTSGFLDAFQSSRGYRLETYLPFLYVDRLAGNPIHSCFRVRRMMYIV